MDIGAIKWFDSLKGFGVIGKPDGTEIFLHKSNLTEKVLELSVGSVLIFEQGYERGKKSAQNVHFPKSCTDFLVIMELFNEKKYVTISNSVTRNDKWGNPFSKKVSKTIDVFKLSLIQFCKKCEGQALLDCLKTYYLNDLTVNKPELFIPIYKFLEQQILECRGKDFPLKDIYDFFGRNLNEQILFNVWIKKEFRLIGYLNLKIMRYLRIYFGKIEIN
ncbi:MAG: cold shock domain-containing protein [Chitinophagales bacterium]|nr:cold shock domain-containing protein [Chitinophagales bacterium]